MRNCVLVANAKNVVRKGAEPLLREGLYFVIFVHAIKFFGSAGSGNSLYCMEYYIMLTKRFITSSLVIRMLIALVISWLIVMAFFATHVVSR
jgi:hypothetical protein